MDREFWGLILITVLCLAVGCITAYEVASHAGTPKVIITITP